MAASATEAKPESYGFSRWEGMDAGVLRLDTEDGEILAKQFSPVRLVLGSSTDLGEGKLFVTTRCVAWLLIWHGRTSMLPCPCVTSEGGVKAGALAS